jgi:hypothetical protein
LNSHFIDFYFVPRAQNEIGGRELKCLRRKEALKQAVVMRDKWITKRGEEGLPGGGAPKIKI